ncbi:MAG: methanethiol S-methyltransferase, partial [Gemmatimonadota bacterium]
DGPPSPEPGVPMGRYLSLLYGGLAYLVFLAVFLYAVAFVGDFAVPRTVDAGPSASVGTALLVDAVLLLLFDSGVSTGLAEALLVDVGLLLLFAVQHSVMARDWFKERWTRVVPEHLERSTYVLFASLVLALIFWQWRPIPGTVWSVEGPGASVLWGLFGLGWAIVLVSTFLIDHFDLFGLRQVWSHFRGEVYEPPEFQEPALYRYVRHPLYLGFLLAFWAIPEMTVGHLLFAAATTGYILVAIRFEESDLLRYHGEQYARYRERVPMLIPRPWGRRE